MHEMIPSHFDTALSASFNLLSEPDERLYYMRMGKICARFVFNTV